MPASGTLLQGIRPDNGDLLVDLRRIPANTNGTDDSSVQADGDAALAGRSAAGSARDRRGRRLAGGRVAPGRAHLARDGRAQDTHLRGPARSRQSRGRAVGLVFTLPEELQKIYAKFGIDLPTGNGDGTWRLPIPARFVIDRAGVIRAVDADPDYTRRPEPAQTTAKNVTATVVTIQPLVMCASSSGLVLP